MKDNYDIKKLNPKSNSYINANNQQEVELELDKCVIEYFENLSDETDIPYKLLINMYLADCVKERKKPKSV